MTEKKQTTTDIKRALRIYLDEIAIRHMTVHFLGLPHLKEEGVLSLEQIYIPITFTDKYKGRDPDVPRTSLIQLLKDHKRVVILGDPGTGKSTLVKHIAYSFARERKTPLQHHFGDLIPVPIILRDYSFQNIDTADGIIEAFWQNIWRGKNPTMELEDFKKALENGKAIFLLDGLDEKGDKPRREHLRKLTYMLIQRYPLSTFIITSRIVGYDEVPFDLFSMPDPDKECLMENLRSIIYNESPPLFYNNKQHYKAWFFEFINIHDLDKPPFKGYDTKLHASEILEFTCHIEKHYIAPFSNKEMDAFIDRWYEAKEQDEEERARKNKNLKTAIHENQSILDLARVPNLLTLMALVNFIYAHLPSGRAKLYEKITEAYLESIDKYRGILTYPVALETKKKWLAHIGFWMQERRTQNEQFGGQSIDAIDIDADILISHKDLIEQFMAVMAPDLGETAAAESAPRFLRYISERSGLLIPRGPDDYAFVHLSFQEFFAAVSLYQRVFRFEELKKHATANLQYRSWHETYILLFELLGINQSGACAELLDAIIHAAKDARHSYDLSFTYGAMAFLSELLLDQETGLSHADRQRAVNFCVRRVADTSFVPSIINNLNNQTIPDIRSLRRTALAEILKFPPQELPPLIMIVAPLLIDNELEWSDQVEEYLQRHPANNWDAEMLIDALLLARQSKSLLAAGLDYLKLDKWMTPKVALFHRVSLSHCLLNRLFDAHSHRASLMLWTSVVNELILNNMYRYCGHLLKENADYQALASALHLAKYLAISRNTAHAQELEHNLHQAILRTLILDFDKNPEPDIDSYQKLEIDQKLNIDYVWDLSLDRALARDQALDKAFFFVKQHIVFPERNLKGWRLNSAKSIHYINTYQVADNKLISALKHMTTKHNNQPERLLGLVALISLGFGNREMAERANAEIKSLYEHGPDPAQWPEEFGSGDPALFMVISKELQKAVPDIFFFESDNEPSLVLLNPELFDPQTPGSKFFTSTPDVFWPDFLKTLNDFANSGKEDKSE